MKYRLKKNAESIQIVDGPYAGRKYEKGKLYDEIPPEEAHRFERIKDKKQDQGSRIKDKKQDQGSRIKDQG